MKGSARAKIGAGGYEGRQAWGAFDSLFRKAAISIRMRIRP